MQKNGFPDELYYHTRSLCPVCQKIVLGEVVPKGNQVFVERTCPEHGSFVGLACSDREWYERLPMFYTDGIKPRNPIKDVQKGCPEDCGLCPSHKQIAGTMAVEISNACNGACPACLANNQKTFELGVADVEAAVAAVLKNQDHIDMLTLSGGEPTIHPQLVDILKVLKRPEIGVVSINSNGIRIAEDDEFLGQLACEDHILVSLHFDGKNAKTLRGVDAEVQIKAVERLNARSIPMLPVALAAKDVNDHELGAIVEKLFLGYPAVKSLIISLMSYTGRGGSTFPVDPLKRLTIPEALERIEASTSGRIKKYDFMPLPMPNPMCAAIGYFLLMEGELTPLIPLGKIEQIVELTKNKHFGRLTPEFEGFIHDAIDRVYTQPAQFPDAQKLLKKFRKLLQILFPKDGSLSAEEREKRVADHVRVVYVMQFMDSWTFDTKRLSRCSCQHVLPGGKIVSSCGYYTYHRRFDARFSISR